MFLLTGCDKFPLQTDYEYNPKKIDIYQHKTCWEFIESRPDILSTMNEAIVKCGLQNYYTQTERVYTYLLLNNDAFANYIFLQLNVTNVVDADSTKLTNMLLYHIVKGNYSAYGQLNYDPIHVLTCWNDINAVMTIKLNDTKTSSADQDKLILMDQCGKSTQFPAVTSNLIMTNGPAHVLGRNCLYVSN
jgi:uncharacterized surface protein with fasciclin (FAS1) repeats